MGYRASCFGWVTLPVVDNYHAACCGWSRCEGNRKRAFFQPLRSSSATSCAGISSFSHESTRFVHAKAVLIRFPNLWLYMRTFGAQRKSVFLSVSASLFFVFLEGEHKIPWQSSKLHIYINPSSLNIFRILIWKLLKTIYDEYLQETSLSCVKIHHPFVSDPCCQCYSCDCNQAT